MSTLVSLEEVHTARWLLVPNQSNVRQLMDTLRWVLMLGARYRRPAQDLLPFPKLRAQFDVDADLCCLTQAQYLRIPFADFNALPLPPGTAHEASFALLADIFPTGWHGLTLSNFKPGETVAVFGAGPVGLMAAYSAFLRGASKIYVVDKVPERLAAARKIAGCIPVDFSAGEDAVDVIIKDNDGKMVDRVRTCRNSVFFPGLHPKSQDTSREPKGLISSHDPFHDFGPWLEEGMLTLL